MTVTPERFKDWLARGRTGSPCIYHTGFLAIDRFDHIYDPNNLDSPPLYLPNYIDSTARIAIDAFDAGKVHLFQRKLHDNEYQYIAMKASRRLW